MGDRVRGRVVLPQARDGGALSRHSQNRSQLCKLRRARFKPPLPQQHHPGRGPVQPSFSLYLAFLSVRDEPNTRLAMIF